MDQKLQLSLSDHDWLNSEAASLGRKPRDIKGFDTSNSRAQASLISIADHFLYVFAEGEFGGLAGLDNLSLLKH